MNWRRALLDGGMLLVLIVLFITFSISIDRFFTFANMQNLGLLVASVSLISCTMLFCLAGGDFDLSVGSTLAFGGMVCVLVSNATGNFFIGALAALASGTLVGLLNGFVIAQLGINALITTLATMMIFRGATAIISGGETRASTLPEFGALASRLGPIPLQIVYAVAFFILFAFLLNRTVFGRNTLAIGGNPEAARLAGVPVVRTKITIFMMSGLVAAFAGIVTASRSLVASTSAGEKMELQAISACVLGGVSLAGGVGSVSGVVVGVLIMGMVQNAMQLRGVDTFWQSVVTGGILLVAVVFDRLKSKAFKES